MDRNVASNNNNNNTNRKKCTASNVKTIDKQLSLSTTTTHGEEKKVHNTQMTDEVRARALNSKQPHSSVANAHTQCNCWLSIVNHTSLPMQIGCERRQRQSFAGNNKNQKTKTNLPRPENCSVSRRDSQIDTSSCILHCFFAQNREDR